MYFFKCVTLSQVKNAAEKRKKKYKDTHKNIFGGDMRKRERERKKRCSGTMSKIEK